MVKAPVIANQMSNSVHVWICCFCGGENDDDVKCSHCGALQIQSKPSAAIGKPDLDNLFLIDPANRRILDGKTVSSLGTFVRLGCVIFVPGFMGIIGLFVLTLIIGQWSQFTSLSRLGVVTRGEVTGRDISEGSDGDDTYYVMFRFLVNGQEFSERQSVNLERYKSVEVGTQVEIEYVAHNPSIAVLAGTNQPPIFMTGFGICWNAFVWGLIIGLVHTNRRDNKLKREGQLICGKVVMAVGKADCDNDYVVTMEYVFKAPETNRLIIGTQRKIRNDLDKATLPKVGTLVVVLFRNEKHHMAL